MNTAYTLLAGTLAVTWAWEAVRTISPWGLPNWLSPLVPLACAMVFVWPDWRIAAAIAGAAAIIRALLKPLTDQPQQFRVTRGVGGRVPPLP